MSVHMCDCAWVSVRVSVSVCVTVYVCEYGCEWMCVREHICLCECVCLCLCANAHIGQRKLLFAFPYHSWPCSFEARSIPESEASLTSIKSQPSSCLCQWQCWYYMHTCYAHIGYVGAGDLSSSFYSQMSSKNSFSCNFFKESFSLQFMMIVVPLPQLLTDPLHSPTHPLKSTTFLSLSLEYNQASNSNKIKQVKIKISKTE